MLFGAGAAVSFAATRSWTSPQARLARMSGSSIAAPDAAGWVTDFLNAAYYRRRPEVRDVEELRLAFAIVTTYWHRRGHRRLRAVDVAPFHRAFGRHRFLDGVRTPRGTLDHLQLLEGAGRLLGPWFAGAYADDARRGWGIAFPTVAEREAYDPSCRLKLAKLGELTAESAPLDEQVWHTYKPVEMPSAERVIAALTKPETWPDYASPLGRFTPLREGGLLGQTFEIEVAAGTDKPVPLWTRGYVTITSLVTPDDPTALANWFEALEAGFEAHGEGRVLPEGAEPIVGFDLTTHAGHFMGSGHNRLVLYSHEGRTWVQAAGTWDPMPWHIDRAYKSQGYDAQHAFWGSDEELSMLRQLALAAAAA
jgi:hypothetical protein